MSSRLVLASYTFDATARTVTTGGRIPIERFLVITDVALNQTIYNFAAIGKGGTASYNEATNETTLTLEFDTTTAGASDTDKLQIYIDQEAIVMEPKESLADPVDRMRVSNPQALIDTDFEYSLQPTKWETLQTQNNIPSVYQKANEPAFTAEQITSITSAEVESQPTSAGTTYDSTLEDEFYTQEYIAIGNPIDAWASYTAAINNNGSSITVVGTSTAVDGDTTMNYPAGIQANDVAIYVGANDFNGPMDPPSGFTLQRDDNNDPDMTLAYRILTGGETGVTGIDDNANGMTHALVVLRGVNTSNIFNALTYARNNNGYCNSPAVTTNANGCAILAIAGIDDDNFSQTIVPPMNFDLLLSSDEGGGQGNNVQGATIGIALYQQDTAGTINPDQWGYLDSVDTSTNIGLPFTQNIQGFSYSQVSVNSEGVLFFNTADATSSDTGLNTANYVTSRHLKVFGQADIALAKVGSVSRGTAPNRTFVVKMEYTDTSIGSVTDYTHVAYVIFSENISDLSIHYYKNSDNGNQHLSNGVTIQTSWTPSTNATGNNPTNGYITRDAFTIDLDVVTRELIRVEVNTPPEQPFTPGDPITIKETADPLYLDGSSIIVQAEDLGNGSNVFYLPNLSPITYGNVDQSTDFTVVYTGGFYFTAEIPFSTVQSVASSKQVRITFSTPPSLFIGSTIFVVDPVSTDTDWIGAFKINKVLSPTEFEYLALTGTNYASTTTLSSGTTKIYVANKGAAQHRYFDGGVQISPETTAPNAKMIRQTKNYFRYQSGKGIQFSTGILFKPTYDIASISVDDNGFDANANIDGNFTVTVESEQYHGLGLPDSYRQGAQVELIDFEVASGNNSYNGVYTVTNVPTPKTFQVNMPVNYLDPVTDLNPGGLAKVKLTGWYDATVRTGLFDDQNGLFLEYDGIDLYAVKRSSTQQLAGLVSITENTATLTGTNTKFKTQLAPNDYVVIKGTTYLITDIQSDTSLTLAPDYKGPTSTNIKIVRVTDLRTRRSDFALDKLDGTGPSGYTFDANKMQMVFIDYSWYGAGRVRYGMRGLDGKVFYFHEYLNNNVNTEAYMRSGNLPGRFEISTASVNGQLAAPLANTDTTMAILTSDADRIPAKGRIIVKDEYMEYTKGNVSGNNTILNLDARNTGFLTNGAVTAEAKTGWLSFNQNAAPVLSHWGVSVLMDGNFDEDKSYLFTASTADTKSVDAGAELPILTIRLAPSVDYGIPSFFGIRNLINRSQLILKNLGVITDGQFVVTAKINSKSTYFETNANWQGAGNGSLAQYVDHSQDATNTPVTDGDIVAQFLTDEGTNRFSASYFDIQDVRPLGNSILGGPNTFPDGPDTLVIFARNNGGAAAGIGVSINWTESQG